MYGEVLRENAYLPRTVEVSENQKVIGSGLYAIVRHPMYASTIFMFFVNASNPGFCLFICRNADLSGNHHF